jgi:hypothetical protein
MTRSAVVQQLGKGVEMDTAWSTSPAGALSCVTRRSCTEPTRGLAHNGVERTGLIAPNTKLAAGHRVGDRRSCFDDAVPTFKPGDT